MNHLSKVNFKSKYVLATIFILGFLARFLVSRFGYNYDYESWLIVGDITSKFKNIFAETSRYNYGFIWAYLIGIYYYIVSALQLTLGYYRVLIILTLTLADAGIAYFVYKKSNIKYAILFFFNPISIIISGFHNQFDNIAIMFALFALLSLEKAVIKKKLNRYDFLSIALLSISLITKHIFFILPVWLFFNSNIDLKRKILYLALPPLFFLLNFTLFLPSGYDNILNNVFLYDSYNNMPLISGALIYFKEFYSSIFRNLFIVGMVVIGFVFRKESLERLFLLYLLAMFSITSAMANQYFVLPLVSLFILGKKERNIFLVWLMFYLILQFDGLNLLNYLLSFTDASFSINYPILDMGIQLLSDFVNISYTVAAWLCFITLLREMKILKKISDGLL
jgi:hypothetical protein